MAEIRSGWGRPVSDFHGGTCAPQAHIRVTFNIDNRSEETLRNSFSAISNPGDSNIIGYGFIGGKYTCIDPKDIIFARVDQTRSGGKTDANMAVFSSFNGEVVPAKITQTEFNSMYRAVGVTQGGSDPNFLHGGDNSGIAGISQGSTTVTNHSEHTFTFGDMVRAVPPSIDAAERLNFHRNMEGVVYENFIPGKYKGLLEPVSYTGILGQVEEGVAILLEGPASLDIPGRLASLQNNQTIDDSDAEGVALNLKRFLSWTCFQTICVLKKNQALLQLPHMDLAQKLGLYKDTVSEDIPLQQDLFSRALVSSLGATVNFDEIMNTIDKDFQTGVNTVTSTSLFASTTQTLAPHEQVEKQGESAFDLFWRSLAHLLEQQGGSVFAQCIGTSGPGQPLDLNVHAL